MRPRIKYGPNQRSHLDDDQFFVVAAQAMTTGELKLLLVKLDGQQRDIVDKLTDINRRRKNKDGTFVETYTDPAQIRNLRETLRRRTNQLRWVRRRLAELERDKTDPFKTPPEEKKLRKKEFLEAFFEIARHQVPYNLFKDMCKTAEKEADEVWLEDEERS